MGGVGELEVGTGMVKVPIWEELNESGWVEMDGVGWKGVELVGAE